MIVCPACATELPEGARFCLSCGARLAVPAAATEERRIVTTLLCDLVGFTAMSEAADPEDVDRLLGVYFSRAAKAIESHGGTVEKFIGDAVVGVFGVPAVHEDDPERAVRAGLRLLEALEGMKRPDGTPLQARCGVNTGEALVRLDVEPLSGLGFLTGDAVNVAARLQAAAPPGGVAVGALTRELTRRVIVYEGLPPVSAKGKIEPVLAWQALAPISRTGADLADAHEAPMVGRAIEYALACGLFDRCVEMSLPQLALIVGEPGIGKSRLVRELLAYVDALPQMVTWRQGRCLPYGEGVTYWPLAEIVRSHAGILDGDDSETLHEKLEAILPDDADRPWYRARLLALLGEPAPEASREENFAAWSRVVEQVAARGPLVVVFEDLHWADEALLAFIEALASGVAEVPLVIVCTARPELFDAHEGFTASLRCASRIDLTPLREADMAQLVSGILDAPGVSPRVQAAIVERSGGNPYFAEESARLLADCGVLVRRGDTAVLVAHDTGAAARRGASGRAATVPLPDTVQALIAARLDALAPLSKAVLADASVVGTTFWAGVVAALGARKGGELEAALRELTAKQFVHRSRSSTMEGEREYVFRHSLAREVAYQQLPRAARVRKHVAAARWIESKTAARPGDLAEVLAHHYATALDLAAASGRGAPGDLAAPTVRYLSLAGDRCLAVDCVAAERYYRRALELAQAYGMDSASVRFSWGKALRACGRDREAVGVLREAADELETKGDVKGAAMAIAQLAGALTREGEPGSHALHGRALTMIDGPDASPELVFVLEHHAGERWATTGDPLASLPFIDRAIDMAAEQGLPQPNHALYTRGVIRCETGDPGGLDDVRRAVEGVRAQGLGDEAGLVLGNFCGYVAAVEGPIVALQAADDLVEFATRRGLSGRVREARGQRVEDLWLGGWWDESLEEARALEAELTHLGNVWFLVSLRTICVMLLGARGDSREPEQMAEWIAQASREGDLPEFAANVHQTAAIAAIASGQVGIAADRVEAWAELPRTMTDMAEVVFLPAAVRIALDAGREALAGKIVEQVMPVFRSHTNVLLSARAAIAERRGECETAAADFADAALGWHDFGVPYEEGHALLGQGRCLAALGRAPEAVAPLAAAREIFVRLGARPALAETDGVVRRVTSA